MSNDNIEPVPDSDIFTKPLTQTDITNMDQALRDAKVLEILTGHNNYFRKAVTELNLLEKEKEWRHACIYADYIYYNKNASDEFTNTYKGFTSDPRIDPLFSEWAKKSGQVYQIFDPAAIIWYNLTDIISYFKKSMIFVYDLYPHYENKREAWAKAEESNLDFQKLVRIYTLLYLWGKLNMYINTNWSNIYNSDQSPFIENTEQFQEFINDLKYYKDKSIKDEEKDLRFKYFHNISYDEITLVRESIPSVDVQNEKRINNLRHNIEIAIENLRLLFSSNISSINICLNNVELGNMNEVIGNDINISQSLSCNQQTDNNDIHVENTVDKIENNYKDELPSINIPDKDNPLLEDKPIDDIYDNIPIEKENDNNSSFKTIIIVISFIIIIIIILLIIILIIKKIKEKKNSSS